MQNGDVVEYGAAEDIFERPRDDYTRKLLAAAFEPTGRVA
jgi:ABC-type microcin C transport system duplicated ATPase subunit YejF